MYRHPSLGLYMLVTDSGLVSERSVVWESLADVIKVHQSFVMVHFLSRIFRRIPVMATRLFKMPIQILSKLLYSRFREKSNDVNLVTLLPYPYKMSKKDSIAKA